MKMHHNAYHDFRVNYTRARALFASEAIRMAEADGCQTCKNRPQPICGTGSMYCGMFVEQIRRAEKELLGGRN